MPIRFRKSFTLFPGVKVNVSKGGTSITVGKRGFHLNFSKRGVRQTVGMPGSGISETSYLFKDEDDEKETKKKERSSESEEEPKPRARRSIRARASSPWGFFLFVFVALFFIYFGANAFGLLPPNLITTFLQNLAHWARNLGI